MKLHEYQAKELLQRHGISTPSGQVAFAVDEARRIAGELGDGGFVVKAQVHAGGRGKAGGVRIVDDADQVVEAARAIIGMRLVTQQDPVGRLVRSVLVERQAPIRHEFYLSMILDRAMGAPCFIASGQGGMDIEEVAERDRQARRRDPTVRPAIVRGHVPVTVGYQPYIGRRIAAELQLEGDEAMGFSVL